MYYDLYKSTMHTYRIYSIRSESQPGLVYIGSTKKTLRQRFQGHQSNYKQYLKGKYHYVTSFKILEIGDAYIELIQECCDHDRKTVLDYEAVLIQMYAMVNKVIPGRSAAQYHQDNKERINTRHKQYTFDNKEKIKQRMKAKRRANPLLFEMKDVLRASRKELRYSNESLQNDIDKFNLISSAIEKIVGHGYSTHQQIIHSV